MNEVNLGDVFYCIEAANFKTYYNKCRLCEGKRELTVKGFTIKCPLCQQEEKALTVAGYKVVRYRVFSITEMIDNSDWKKSDQKHKKYGLYHKHGKGYSYFENNHKNIEMNEMYLKKPFLNKTDVTKHNFGSALYSDYKLAVEIADKLTAESVEEVKRYNIEHGTDYELPLFYIEHDKKSK